MPQITVSRKAYARIKHFSQKAGITLSASATDAVNEWMDITGDCLLVLLERRRDKVQSQQKETKGPHLILTKSAAIPITTKTPCRRITDPSQGFLPQSATVLSLVRPLKTASGRM